MIAAVKYRGRLLSVRQRPKGFVWQFEDGTLFTEGPDVYPTRLAAMQAAKAAIDEEDGISEGGRTLTPLEQAKEAVRASRDFRPRDGRRFDHNEVEQLSRLCADAVRSCTAAGVTIAQMRLELWREEHAAYQGNLDAISRARVQAICDEFKAAALAQGGER